jgi:hypothetical protein
MGRNCKSCRRDLDESHFDKTYKTCNECRTKKKKRIYKKLTLKDCQDLAEAKGGDCLSTVYRQSELKMKWRCSKGHEWNASSSSIKDMGSWCPHCVGKAKHTLKDCQDLAESKGGDCLSTVYRQSKLKLKWRCSKGHEWNASISSIKISGSWCPHCVGKAKHTLGQCQRFAEAKGGKCLSTEYIGCLKKMKWRCSKGHEWNAPYSAIKNNANWCPVCSRNRSMSEEFCRSIFEKNLLENFPSSRPKWLERLELDGYNEELSIAFEYNGKQHYEYVPFFHKNGPVNLEAQKSRDRKKYKLCHKYGVKLVIIPYQYSYLNPEELEGFIVNELWKIV